MIKEIIFDCFGVLTEDGWLAFLAKYANEETEDELGLINFQYDRGQLSYGEFVDEVCRVTGVQKSIVHNMVTTGQHPNYRLLEYIQELKGRGYALGLISNVGVSLRGVLPDEFLDQFDTITLSYEIGVIKPESGIFEAHLAKTGFSAGEAIFIDDREINCEGAQAVGMQAVWYRDVRSTKIAVEKLLT